MRVLSPRAARSVFALVAVALSGCGETTKPTEAAQSISAAQQGASHDKKPVSPVSIGALTLSSSALTVGGASVTLTATIENSGPSLSNISATCTIAQKKTFHTACTTISSFGGEAGVLPTGTSTITIPVVASNDSAGQGAFVSGNGTLQLSLLAGSSPLAEQTAQIRFVPIAFLTNATFTNFNPGNADFSGSDMFAAVQSFGYAIAPFSSLDDATWAAAAQSNVMVIPQLSHDLFSVMSAAQRQTVVDFVNRGGTLITVIDGGDRQNNQQFLNQLFGTFLRRSGAEQPKLSADATGTSFAGGASALVEFTPGLLLSSIPKPFLGVYLSEGFGGVGTVSEVTVIRPTTATSAATGQIIVLGFDWTFGAPVGPLDGGWNDVLHRAIQFASSSF
jgi:hypothetical protein